ncbi:MAG: hypothetical protein A2857_03490 [Candidatus Levybacteria bacterium RIFCSPHIGHO2_01_FULL_36_15]|nr:MAG: hypothetical protein A2857_03490 [Candidatus Levybacteria bacterium RIFCSPHIGHO2_01_FULL_36_15]
MAKKEIFKKYIFLAVLAGIIGGVVGAGIEKTYDDLISNKLQSSISVRKDLGKEFNNNVFSEESTVQSIIEKSSPAVISILSRSSHHDMNLPSADNPEFIGSGFIVSNNGLIVTNAHVVNDSDKSYFIVTSGKKMYPIQEIKRFPEDDIAILSINASNLPFIKLGNSDQVKQGQKVIAIGTILGNLQNSATTGIISATNRQITASDPMGTSEATLDNLIQVDASLNPGDSGGPLLNLSGEAIGINFATTEGAQNVGFAIPINNLKTLIEKLNKQ